MVIATDPPVEVQIDGEDLGRTPLEAEIRPGGVKFVVGDRYHPEAEGAWLLSTKRFKEMLQIKRRTPRGRRAG